MNKEHDLQKIYELIEKYDFEELQESEKLIVRRHISENEYNKMRSTFMDTKDFFKKLPEPVLQKTSNFFKRIARYPVELYKIAAIIAILIATGIIFTKVKTPEQQELLTMIDTVYLEITDTVEIIKEIIVYENLPPKQNLIIPANNTLVTTYYQNDCSYELCPDDLESFRRTKYKGNFSNDSALADFIVSTN